MKIGLLGLRISEDGDGLRGAAGILEIVGGDPQGNFRVLQFLARDHPLVRQLLRPIESQPGELVGRLGPFGRVSPLARRNLLRLPLRGRDATVGPGEIDRGDLLEDGQALPHVRDAAVGGAELDLCSVDGRARIPIVRDE